MVNQVPPATSRRSRTRLVVQVVLSLVLVVAIFYFLRRKFDPAQAWAAVTAMTWLELGILGLLAVWNLCTYGFVWMAVTPGLGFWRAMEMTQATTAVANTVPGGSAIGIGMTYSMLGSWGYSRSRSTTAVLVSGVWNSFIKLGMPVLALALVALQGGATGGGSSPPCSASPGWSPRSWCSRLCCAAPSRPAGSGCWPVGPPPGCWGWWGGGRWRAGSWPRSSSAPGLLAWSSIAGDRSRCGRWSATCRCMRCCWWRCGMSGSATPRSPGREVLAVFAFARLTTAIPLTPGGLGFVEGGAGHRAGGGGWRPGPGGRRGGGLPGVDLGPAHPGRGRLLCVVATAHLDHVTGGCVARPEPGDRDRQPRPPAQTMTPWNPPHGRCSRVWLASPRSGRGIAVRGRTRRHSSTASWAVMA